MKIGLKPDSVIREAKPYRDIKPIVFYGSSIVHGTAASRPGNIYPSIISRNLNIDHRNIGFFGNAKGEPVLAKWMATLPMSLFVCDYTTMLPQLSILQKHITLCTKLYERKILMANGIGTLIRHILEKVL